MKVLGVVCHDAGGAEVVSSWLNQTKNPFLAYLEGPAVKIFKEKLGIENRYSMNELLNRVDWLLCSTSWQNDVEIRAIKQAQKLGKLSVAFLDHWVNYDDRFNYQGDKILPDEIWVCDKYAMEMASIYFPETSLKIVSNPYFQDLKVHLDKIRKEDQSTGFDILYVCEPVRDHYKLKYGNENCLGYTEEDALIYFFNNLDVLPIKPSSIVVRPHPADDVGKYDWVTGYQTKFLTIRVDCKETLIKQVVKSKLVVGCESMAMVVGLLAKKLVFTSIPPGGRNCALPHNEIFSIKSLRRKFEND